MKLMSLITASLIAGSVSLTAQEITTQQDLKVAIDKLIRTKADQADQVDLDKTNQQVAKNTESISKLEKEVKEVKENIKNIKVEASKPALVGSKTVVNNFSETKFVQKYTGIVFNCYALNLRKDPSTDNKPRDWLKRGDIVKVVGGSDNGWLNVLTSRGAGWVSGRYIKSK